MKSVNKFFYKTGRGICGFALLLITPLIIRSQCSNTCGSNLLPNPSFELFNGSCSTADIQIYSNLTPVENWFGTEQFDPIVMAGSTPDYFSPCAGTTNNANNACITGSARVGLFTKASFANGREYVQARLTTPLIAGKTYCFSMVVKSRVGAAGNIISSCDGIGAWIHNQGLIDIDAVNGGQQFLGPGSLVNAMPQVENPPGNLIGGSCQVVTGSFCAVGGEEWIVIGNFRTDANTQMSGSNPSNYMYIDDVNLFEICSTPLDAEILITQNNLCPGTCTNLSAAASGLSGNYTYNWMPGGLTTSTINICPSQTTTYTLTTTSTTACGMPESIIDTITVFVNNCFNGVNAIGANICSGSCTNISASASGSSGNIVYNWQPGNVTGNSINVCPATTTVYTVTATDQSGLSYTDTCIVVVNNLPGADAGFNDTICLGSSTTLTAHGAGFYSWNTVPVQNASSIIVQPSATTVYVLTVNNGGCVETDSVLVFVGQTPQVIVQTNNISCNGLNDGNVTANISGGTQPFNFYWMPGNIISTSMNNLAAGTYTFYVNDNAGCNAQQIVTISEPEILNVQITGVSELCAGSVSNLWAEVGGGSGAYSFNWHGAGGASSQISINPVSSTNYSLTVTDVNACMQNATHMVNVNPVPHANFIGTDTACVPFNVEFTNLSSGANAYEWNFGDESSATFLNPIHGYNVDGTFNVSLVAISINGCRDTFEIKNAIKAVALPVNQIVASSISVSEYEPVVEYDFSSQNSVSCLVEFGDGTNIHLCEGSDYGHFYNAPGDYCARIISLNELGCSSENFVCINVYPEFTFYVPNSFTPDGDGINDTFSGYGSNFKDFEMYIYNRWGQLIYHSNDYNQPWDGTVNGKTKIAQTDVFIYKILVGKPDGNKKEFNGQITLIR